MNKNSFTQIYPVCEQSIRHYKKKFKLEDICEDKVYDIIHTKINERQLLKEELQELLAETKPKYLYFVINGDNVATKAHQLMSRIYSSYERDFLIVDSLYEKMKLIKNKLIEDGFIK